jgi:integrase
MLRKRIPTRLRGVSGRTGDTVKITTGTADRAEALRRWPGVLAQYAALEAEWECKANVRALSRQEAQQLASAWAAWIVGGAPLALGGLEIGCASDVFEPLSFPEMRTPARLQAMTDRVDIHVNEALRLGRMDVTLEGRQALWQAMLPVVNAAYMEADLTAVARQRGGHFLAPLAAAREALPPVPAELTDRLRPAARVTISGITEAWKTVATIKPRSVADTLTTMTALRAFLGHDDAGRVTKADILRWRGALTATITNNTWNNKLAMVAKVFARAVADGVLPTNQAERSLRLDKSATAQLLPYTDDEARCILVACRRESRPSLRWAHWVMAFTGMRIAEVLQLSGSDVRQQDGVWIIDVNEDGTEKSVKTAKKRNVPIHSALQAEGFLAYAGTIATDAPLFPDKRLDAHGLRGGRGWQVTGRWVRTRVGLIDPRKPPNHAWRHRLEDEMRAVGVPEDARDAITGHARGTTGRNYGVRGESLRRLDAELAKVPADFLQRPPDQGVVLAGAMRHS